MLTDDEEFKVQNFDDIEELEHSTLYSFADLKAFKIVKHENDELSDITDEEAFTDEEEDDVEDTKIPIGR